MRGGPVRLSMQARAWWRASAILVALGVAFAVWASSEKAAAQARTDSCVASNEGKMFVHVLCMDLGGMEQVLLSMFFLGAGGLAALVAAFLAWRARMRGPPAESAEAIQKELKAIERELAVLDPPR